MDLKELHGWAGNLEAHWYYASKAGALRRLLRGKGFRRIADIGAGSGFFARQTLRVEHAREAYCIDVNYERDWEECSGGKRLWYRRSADRVEADLYLLMDVLEHVEDDLTFLRSIVNAAPPGAHFVVSVPAFKFLWSRHDEFLGHYRRYTLRDATTLLRSAGLVVEKSGYYFGLVFPAAAALRLCRKFFSASGGTPSSDMRELPFIANFLLRQLCRLEESVFLMNRCFGLTAFVLARRG